MSWLRLDEQSATVVAIIMIAICIVFRVLAARGVARTKTRWVASASLEVAVVCALFAIWQVANALTQVTSAAGFKRGYDVWRFERWLHIPSEHDVQDLIIHHPEIVKATNYYYDVMHLTLMVVFLTWLWLRHRDRYPRVRNTIAAFTLMALLIQMVSVAPPRLIPQTHMIDTAMVYGQSVYTYFSNIADQYAAMPSIHVGWAVLISISIVKCSPSRWRWLGLLHGLITIFVVVATANHYWADGFVACALLVPAYFIAKGIDLVVARFQRAELAPAAQIQQGAFS